MDKLMSRRPNEACATPGEKPGLSVEHAGAFRSGTPRY